MRKLWTRVLLAVGLGGATAVSLRLVSLWLLDAPDAAGAALFVASLALGFVGYAGMDLRKGPDGEYRDDGSQGEHRPSAIQENRTPAAPYLQHGLFASWFTLYTWSAALGCFLAAIALV